MDGIGSALTMVFGTHDAEHRANKPALMNLVQRSEYDVFRQGPTNLGIEPDEVLDESLYDEETDRYAGGLGNTVINLRDPDSGEIYYSFILMDTGDWQNMAGNQTAKKRTFQGARPISRVGVGLTKRQRESDKWVIERLIG